MSQAVNNRKAMFDYAAIVARVKEQIKISVEEFENMIGHTITSKEGKAAIKGLWSYTARTMDDARFAVDSKNGYCYLRPIQDVKVEKPKNVVASRTTDEAQRMLNALKKDNEKLFAELEAAKNEKHELDVAVSELRFALKDMKRQYAELQNVTVGLVKLAGLTA